MEVNSIRKVFDLINNLNHGNYDLVTAKSLLIIYKVFDFHLECIVEVTEC